MIGITNNWLKLHGNRTKRRWPSKRRVLWKAREKKWHRRKADWKLRKMMEKVKQCEKSGRNPVFQFADELHGYRNQ